MVKDKVRDEKGTPVTPAGGSTSPLFRATFDPEKIRVAGTVRCPHCAGAGEDCPHCDGDGFQENGVER